MEWQGLRWRVVWALSALSLMWLTAESAWSASVTLAWDPSPETNIVHYVLRYGPRKGVYTNQVTVTQNELRATVPGLTPGLNYFFAVFAVDSNGRVSLPSNVVEHRISTSELRPAQDPPEPPLEEPLLSDYSTPGVRNDFDGFVGIKITVGPAPILLTALGRIFLEGNSGTHLLKVVDAQTHVDVDGAATVLSMEGGTPGRLTYSRLPEPVILEANAGYFIVSKESLWGDTWQDFDTVVTVSDAVRHGGAVFAGSGVGWTTIQLLKQSPGPVGALFTRPTAETLQSLRTRLPSGRVPLPESNLGDRTSSSLPPPLPTTGFYNGSDEGSGSTTIRPARTRTLIYRESQACFTNVVCGIDQRFVREVVPGTARNDFTGFVGMRVRIGNEPLAVTALGRLKLEGNRQTHALGMVRASDGQVVPGGQISVDMADGQAGQFIYGQLPFPVVAEANTEYYFVSSEVDQGDLWYGMENTVVTTDSTGLAVRSVFLGIDDPWTVVGLEGHCYGPVDFRYRPVELELAAASRAPESVPQLKIEIRDTGPVLVVTGPAGLDFAMETSDDLLSWWPAGTFRITGAPLLLELPRTAEPKRFYRIAIGEDQ